MPARHSIGLCKEAAQAGEIQTQVDLDKGLPFLKRKLIELGAPKGSTLEYQLEGKKIEIPVRGR